MAESSVVRTASDALTAKRSLLDVGYRPIPENVLLYRDLIDLFCSESKLRRRQTPLVNAGYAVRLGLITSAVHSFLKFHADRPVQMVILGCGFDILSFWAYHLNMTQITIFEFDTPEIVNAKKQLLLQKKIIEETRSSGNKGFSGRIIPRFPMNDNKSAVQDNYFLFPCDLRKVKSIESCREVAPLKEMPTLVVSELVLVYLGQQATDKLLHYIAKHLCSFPGSMMAMFEPLEPKLNANSILENYKEHYNKKFIEKLSRGLAHRPQANEIFHPLGCSVSSVQNRLEKCGFKNAWSALAGDAFCATCVHLECPEFFDEHAALHLNLCSYTIAMGFPMLTPVELVQKVCPWSGVARQTFLDRRASSDKKYTIRRVQAHDQTAVRKLYKQNYEILFHEYPSVRKMVKSALKKDLNFDEDEAKVGYATIDARYRFEGGIFLIAADAKDLIVGCVGLQRRQASKQTESKSESCYVEFEIHKLAVLESHRGKGLAKDLLGCTESFLALECNGTPCKILASTPAILLAANHLYLSCGFQLEIEQLFGNMTINTYTKVLQLDN
mmetsp:Transcript_12044/g.18477  ORF Transcript_12044/g.18477 Transcript_12044/m.18477 type:complete len:555 (-) Transcript_12044:5-1669(-)